MGGGLFGGHIPHLLPRPAAEWAAGGGEHNAINLSSRPGAQALGHGGVFRVDGDDLAGGGGFGDKRAPGDEGFFIGKGEGSTDFDGGHGGGEPEGSDQRVEDGIAGDGFHQVGGGGGAGADGTAEGGGDSFGRLGVGDGNVVGVEPQGLGLVDDELGVSAGGRDSDDVEFVGVVGDDLECLGANGSGAAEDNYVFDHISYCFTFVLIVVFICCCLVIADGWGDYG